MNVILINRTSKLRKNRQALATVFEGSLFSILWYLLGSVRCLCL